jgi:hypothetical protein
MGTLHEDLCVFMIASCWILLRKINDSDENFVEKIKTHVLYSINLFRNSCRLWHNVGKMVQPDGWQQMTTRCIRFAIWITKAIDTHSEYVIIIAFPRQQVSSLRPSVLRYTYTHCLSCSKMGAQLVEALRCKPEYGGFNSRWGHRDFSLT